LEITGVTDRLENVHASLEKKTPQWPKLPLQKLNTQVFPGKTEAATVFATQELVGVQLLRSS
jgi:hypothetical protein